MSTITQIPKVIAHRGLSSQAPENTLPAFEIAAQQGFHWLEFDVMLSKDAEPVIFHDEKLSRTSNGVGKVADKTLEELKALDAGQWFDAQFANTKIPTLVETIELMKKYDLNAVVELKPNPGQAIATTVKTLGCFQKLWPEGLEKVIFASFSIACLIETRKHLPKQALGIGMHKWSESDLEIAQALDCFSLHVYHKILTEEKVKRLKSHNRHILTYTVNSAKRAKKLYQWGVEGIFSDSPDKLL